MTQHVLIGLTGAPGSGKDTCAKVLERHGFKSVAFADALRQEIATAFRVDVRFLTDRSLKEQPLPLFAIGMCTDTMFLRWAQAFGEDIEAPRSARWVMQRWGTDFRRALDEHYWVAIVRQWIYRQAGIGCHRWVITDVRMQNEANLVADLRGKVLRVHRPDVPRLAPETADHASQQPLHDSMVAGVIHNEGSLESLADEVEAAVVAHFGFDVISNPRAA